LKSHLIIKKKELDLVVSIWVPTFSTLSSHES
jgi:hypothetical protein